jgi:hypothetical protein
LKHCGVCRFVIFAPAVVVRRKIVFLQALAPV